MRPTDADGRCAFCGGEVPTGGCPRCFAVTYVLIPTTSVLSPLLPCKNVVPVSVPVESVR